MFLFVFFIISSTVSYFSCSQSLSQVYDVCDNCRSLTVNGHVELSVLPDLCTIILSKQSIDLRSAAVAYDDTINTMTNIINIAKKIGIDSEDIQTINFSLQPIYRTDPTNGKIINEGYQASEDLLLKVRNTSKIGPLLNASVRTDAKVKSLQFSIEFIDSYTEMIRHDGITKAKLVAMQISKSANITLLKVIAISETTIQPCMMPMYQVGGFDLTRKTESPNSAVSAGELKLCYDVTVTYQFE